MACVVPESTETASVPAIYLLGERQAEGLGRVRLVNLASVEVGMKPVGGDDNDVLTTNEAEFARQNVFHVADDIRNRKLKDKEFRDIFTPSFIGRMSLMVRESQSKADLTSRIKTIKNSKKQDVARDIVNKVEQSLPGNVSWPLERECLDLVLDLAKYFSKQTKGNASEGSDA